MKGLTMNRLALAGLRANRKEYRQMAVGIFLAVFLAVGTALGIWAMWEKKTEIRQTRFGSADGFFFRSHILDPELMTRSGYISGLGTVSVLGTADGIDFGYYDEEAEAILQRQFLSGGMPQAPNEIALDETARNSLCPDAAVGDTVTLELVPRAVSRQERSFVLSGIFRSHIGSTMTDAEKRLPDILVYRDDPDFLEWNTERTYVFTLSSTGTMQNVYARFSFTTLVGIDPLGEPYDPKDTVAASPLASLLGLEYTSPVLLAGGALLLAAMIGIFDAASGQFARKEKQYRLLRALGATRRQIGAVSRRETVLLALLLAPGAALCAIGFVKLCCGLLPEDAAFAFPAPLLLGSLALSFLLVWAASSLPVLWSFRGGVLEEKASPVCRTSKKQFAPARLLAWRELKGHPFRTFGCIALVVLLNVTTVLLGTTSLEKLRGLDDFRDAQAFVAEQRSPGSGDGIGDEALEALRALPGVSSVQVQRCAKTYALTNRVGTYYPLLRFTNPHLSAYHPEITYGSDSTLERQSTIADQEWHQKLQSILDTDQAVITTYLLTVEDLSFFAPYLLEGTIDEEAINSGEAVLVYAPDYYIQYGPYGRSVFTDTSWQEPGRELEVAHNDQFLLGSTQVLAQVDPDSENYVPFAKKGQEPVVSNASAEICGIVGAFQTYYNAIWYAPAIITTAQGAASLGLDVGPVEYLEMELDGTVPDSVLEPQINYILGGDDYDLVNNAVRLRDARRSSAATLLFLGSLALALLACTVIMLRGSCARDMQAKANTIRILWSLGCDDKDQATIWRREMAVIFLAAFPISVITAMLLMDTLSLWWNLKNCLVFSVISSILGAALCLMGLGRTLHEGRTSEP